MARTMAEGTYPAIAARKTCRQVSAKLKALRKVTYLH